MFPNKELDDLIILRSDGNPTYNLAVVVDDHDMGVTHVIRGVDHLTNAARQTQIYQAMGWDVPMFAHVPLIHGPDGAKLSKRHGALGVEAYRAMGYLPAALRNYLVRLGWSHGNDEIMSTAQMVEWFDLDGIGRSPARFDFAKLEDLNGHYIRATQRPGAAAAARGHPAVSCRAAATIVARLDANMRAKLAHRHAGPQGARQDAARAGRGRRLSCSPSGRSRSTTRPQKLLDAEAPRARSSALLPELEAAEHWLAAAARGRSCAPTPRPPAPSSARLPSRCAPR